MVQKPRSPQSLGSASPPEEYFDQTIEVCQPYSEHTIARDDARAIATNVLGFRVSPDINSPDEKTPSQDNTHENAMFLTAANSRLGSAGSDRAR